MIRDIERLEMLKIDKRRKDSSPSAIYIVEN